MWGSLVGRKQRFDKLSPNGVRVAANELGRRYRSGKPGTPEFRQALRDAIEGLREFVGTQAVFNLSDKDHNGVDDRSQVMVKVEGGAWKLEK